MRPTWKWTVATETQTGRADRAICDAISFGHGEWTPPTGDRPTTSRNQIQRLIDEGHVLVNGKIITANARLLHGALVEVQFPAPITGELIPEDRPLEILFEDEHLAVLNKPPGLTVHPSSTQRDGTLVHALLHHIKDLSGIGGVLRPGIVHRLDRNTSGALVITKTDLTHQRLSEVFAKHLIERRYWALCYGALESPDDKELRIETQIGRSTKDRKKMSVLSEGGRTAITHLKSIERYADKTGRAFASLIEARLETGRTHQVRVHLTHQGNSILGDPAYGMPSTKHTKWLSLPRLVREAVEAMPGQALHARVLGFKHPITSENLRFEATPPPAYSELLAQLRHWS